MSAPERVWRLGPARAPLDFVPRELASWQHRFDDPLREYRTLYCAEDPATCLREVLADLRPNTTMLAELEQLFGTTGAAGRAAGAVSAEWREAHLLVPARVAVEGAVVDLDDVALRERLKSEHAALLAAHGMEQLDIAEVRSRTRAVTQVIARSLYGEGAAAVSFRSALDDRPCLCLFEGRADLLPDGEPLELAEDLDLLLQVCSEYGLRLL